MCGGNTSNILFTTPPESRLRRYNTKQHHFLITSRCISTQKIISTGGEIAAKIAGCGPCFHSPYSLNPNRTPLRWNMKRTSTIAATAVVLGACCEFLRIIISCGCIYLNTIISLELFSSMSYTIYSHLRLVAVLV